MITVKYKQRYKKHKIVVSGHAYGGPEGHDLICAAATALVITVIGALTANDVKFHEDVRDGYAEIRSADPAATSVFNTVMCGFEMLRVMYPEHVEILY